MAQTREESDLTDDLKVQQVILRSLKDETYEGADQDREEARREIENIEQKLLQLSEAKKLEASESDSPEHRTGTGTGTGESASSPAVNPDAAQVATNGSDSRPITPMQSMSQLDWQSPSLSLRQEKRTLSPDAFHSSHRPSKSRRTSPLPGMNFSSPSANSSSFSDVEVIDLTGNDVDSDSDQIARELQNQRIQERDLGRSWGRMWSNETPIATADTARFANQFPTISGIMDSSEILQASHTDFTDPGTFSFNSPMGNGVSVPGAWPLSLESDPFNPDLSNVNPDSFAGFEPDQLSSPALELPNPNPTSDNLSLNWPVSTSGPTLVPSAPNNSLATAASGQDTMADIIRRTSAFGSWPEMDGSLPTTIPDRLATFLNDSYNDPRVTEKDIDDLLRNISPDMEIPEIDRDGTPEGLKSALYPHQNLALTWMKKMEDGTNKGGILADDMGLGKTISTLALMLSRPATNRTKTNLIIGPLSLVRQWEDEIKKKIKPSHSLSVFRYHGKKATTDDLLKYDVVLTTYGTIASEYNRWLKFRQANDDRNINLDDRAYATKFPLLHPDKAIFHRIILDEAQCIKNRSTKTAQACHTLKATYRWCLTGTPMMNSILELYSLLAFLQIKPYCGWEQFRKAFGVLFGKSGTAKSTAMNRLQALLKAIMLRRKKDSKLDGQPILRLPSKTEEVVYADLSQDERDFYSQLERRSQVQFSKYLRDGSIGKNYSNILVLLLRLRQACCHPHLNLDVDDRSLVTEDDVKELVKKLDPTVIDRIKAVEGFECPICYDAVQCPSFFIPCGHDSCQQCLTRLIDGAPTANIRNGSESDKAKCPVCRGLFDPKHCFTYEAFREIHMPETIPKVEEVEDEGDETDDFYSDSEDESDFDDDDSDDIDEDGNLKGFVVNDGFDDRDYGNHNSEHGKHQKKAKGKGKSKGKGKEKEKKAEIKPSMLKSLRRDAQRNKAAYKRYMQYLRKTWLPAAKISECIRLLREIQESGEKTIVFSQWTLLLDLIEVGLWHERETIHTQVRRYDGSMTSDERFASAQDFREKKDVKVILVSLRAGNAGLNLTAASRVIIMDPFWNPYIEMQAVDRAYRIGQTNEVKIYRILTRDTVEDRIVALQDKKKEMVEAALDENESTKIGRLGPQELKFLFGTGS